MTNTNIVNWIFLVIGIVVFYYIKNENNTVFIAVRDKNNKIHKVPVKTTDSEDEVVKKINKYMKKIN